MSMAARCASLLLLASGAQAGFKIEAMQHDIQQITEKNFDGVIGKFRDFSVSALWCFKDDNAADKTFLEEYNKVGKELKGMAKVTAINCNDWPKFCTKNKCKENQILMYPVNPFSAYLFEGKMEAKAVSAKLSKMIPDQSTRVTKDNVDSWLTSDASKPKVLVFSNKKNPPLILKALSSDTVFRRGVKFGFVTEEDADVCSKFKVNKFPSVVMQRRVGADFKKETYSGDINFAALKEWVNPYVESGMGDKVGASSAKGQEETNIEDDQPWLSQEIPEMTAKSSPSICFKGEGLCVIYLKDGAADQKDIDMLTGLSKKFTSQLSDRGAKMKFMWMNLALEKDFKELFGPAQLPSAVVFNPHKRLRFAKLDHGEEGEVKGDEQGLAKLVDKVLGGDARFAPVPGQKLPGWSVREAKAKPGKDGKKEL